MGGRRGGGWAREAGKGEMGGGTREQCEQQNALVSTIWLVTRGGGPR